MGVVAATIFTLGQGFIFNVVIPVSYVVMKICG